MSADSTQLATVLVEHIRAWGPITFAKYMDACLYDPQHGYYTRADQLPRRDYFTSVDASPIFGRLLARQLQEMWVQLGHPAEFVLVELGAAAGNLAAQVLDFTAESFPEFYSALQYAAVERSATRRTAAAATLAPHLAARHFAMLSDMPAEIPCGCIFSNEFFDALPVHRLVRDGKDVREIYVGRRREWFVRTIRPAFFGRACRISHRAGNHAPRRTARGSKPGSLRLDRGNGRAPGPRFCAHD